MKSISHVVSSEPEQCRRSHSETGGSDVTRSGAREGRSLQLYTPWDFEPTVAASRETGVMSSDKLDVDSFRPTTQPCQLIIAMDPSPIQLPDNAPLVLGPPIVGVALNWWLYGIFTMQYVMYLNNPRHRDGIFLRGIVHFLFLLDTAQTFMIMDDAFFWFVYNFGDFTALFKFNLASIDGPVLDSIITLTVQLVYCWRLWILGGWKVLPIISALLALVSCVSGMTAGIHSILSPTHIKAAEYLWLFATAVTDLIIAGSMTHLLLKYRTENMAVTRTTMAVVKRILTLTLETNAVTAAVAIALVTSFLVPSIAPPKTNVYLTLGYVLGKMYSNCFLVLLNQRIYYTSLGRSAEEMDTLNSASHRPGMRGKIPRSRNSLPSRNKTTGQVSVIQFTETRTVGTPEIEMDDFQGTKNGRAMYPIPSHDFV